MQPYRGKLRRSVWGLCVVSAIGATGCLDIDAKGTDVGDAGTHGDGQDCSLCHHASDAPVALDETNCAQCHHAAGAANGGFDADRACSDCHHQTDAALKVEEGHVCSDCHHKEGAGGGFEAGHPCADCHHSDKEPAIETGKECADCHHKDGAYDDGLETNKDCSVCHHKGGEYDDGLETGTDCSVCHHKNDDFTSGDAAMGDRDCADCHHNPEWNQSQGCDSCHPATPTTGAHTAHLSPKWRVPMTCADCHPVPTNWFDAGHIDAIVDVDFSAFAATSGLTPVWNGRTCVDVYCHGASRNDGVLTEPAWAEGQTVGCDSCHGNPPTATQTGVHPANSSCALCHSAAFSGTELVPEVHINGSVNRASAGK